ncbi:MULTISPECIES: four-helix bundle copper-binding protein [Clostridium]|uniref:Four-helix bundle copper-binding protein n=1 Tax=Clostridium aquiflavi TaxID=3073603 RepID=A0ABU1EFB6_9CLOT|nr:MULTISPECIES: four-helix bundle copper-binding protein [unclassified Clostridium]MDR5587081.1 four-helix bundle copper-binding protein [Clostridium sp. 5N-1]NFG61285.1 four-helix bundle copper-binding protein [Clostridium botulinum]NFQ09244.1 four-helix bundle copper-binding protein [Clostridium botulinum]
MGIVTTTTDNYQKCIDECSRCTQACYECFEACINEPDLKDRRICVKILIECAKMCEMSIGIMSMNGKFAKEHCKMCATVCDTCAQECSMFKDDHCQKCAQECKTCADECRKMSGM